MWMLLAGFLQCSQFLGRGIRVAGVGTNLNQLLPVLQVSSQKIDFMARRGTNIGQLVAASQKFDEYRRFESVTRIAPAASIEYRDQALRELTICCRSEVDSIHTIRTKKQSSKLRSIRACSRDASLSGLAAIC